MSAAKWLDYRKQGSPRVQIPIKFPEQVGRLKEILKPISLYFQPSDDIITVDNIYKFVEPPRGPDVFTVNVESALNFGKRY